MRVSLGPVDTRACCRRGLVGSNTCSRTRLRSGIDWPVWSTGWIRTRSARRRPVSFGRCWTSRSDSVRPGRRCWPADSGRPTGRSRQGPRPQSRTWPAGRAPRPGRRRTRWTPRRGCRSSPMSRARCDAVRCRWRRPQSFRLRWRRTRPKNTGWWSWPGGSRSRSCGRNAPGSGPRRPGPGGHQPPVASGSAVAPVRRRGGVLEPARQGHPTGRGRLQRSAGRAHRPGVHHRPPSRPHRAGGGLRLRRADGTRRPTGRTRRRRRCERVGGPVS